MNRNYMGIAFYFGTLNSVEVKHSLKLFADEGEKCYLQAPLQEVKTEADVRRWNRLNYQPVDYDAMDEAFDAPTLADIDSCADGACDAP